MLPERANASALKSHLLTVVRTRVRGQADRLVDGGVRISGPKATPVYAAQHRRETTPRALRKGGLEETLFELQRTIGNAGVIALLAGEAPMVQRQVGWPDPVGAKNAGQRTVGSVDRYPIYGLSVGNQDPVTKNKKTKWMDDDTLEKADKRAIVLIPQNLKPSSKPDVLFELHGHYIGWREGAVDNPGSGAVKGQTRDEGSEGIIQSLPNNTIAVLPQGTASSGFGSMEPSTYIGEALKMIPGWEKAETGRLLYSAHSGGGGTLDPGLGPQMGAANKRWKAGRKERQAMRQARLPGGLREIALFDAINSGDQLNSVRGWLWDSVNDDIDQLKGKSTAEQEAYLQTVVVFRGYYEGSSELYPPLYRQLNELRNSLLGPSHRPKGISKKIWKALGEHYLVIGPVAATHGQMVKKNLPKALAAMNLEVASK